MAFIIIHGIVYDGAGFPHPEVLRAYFVDLCDADQREEHIRFAQEVQSYGLVRIEAYALDNLHIPLNGLPYNYITEPAV